MSGPCCVCCGMYSSLRGCMWTLFHMCPSCIQESSVLSSVDGAGSVVVDLLVGISCVLAGAFVVKRCVEVNVADHVGVSCLFASLSSIFFGATVVVFVGTVVPAFSLNQVSPVQACPCRTRFC